ncbi:hypothetical protein Aru02nite_33670 [Actinocatenispora rupis]|uniref:Major facilitator superfamily (MFS) profile domain-containing protein n=1 Tax=Actinocatenispora rupis TaxID=519421 RepID=A0A8J3JAK7_9ACTN|nr:hypothetical protein Aru02nite_33670 [Actinocatenispora rupis]
MAVVLAAAVGLSGADLAAMAAVTDNVERAYGVDNAQIGLLVSVVTLVGAAGTVPVGVLTDRTRRTRLLGASVAVWAVATAVSAAAPSYWWLLAGRALLGLAAATTGPTVASLTGDFFPAAQRSRVYGIVLSGELVGSGVGYVGAGEISAVASWRFAFWWLVPVAVAVAWLVWRLPEPARGRQPALRADPAVAPLTGAAGGTAPPPHPERLSPWAALRYVLSVRTNVVIIVGSALGYFFFAAVRSFAILFAGQHYGVPKSVASLLVVAIGVGALVGVVVGGRLSDRLLHHGRVRAARVAVPAVCLLALAPVFAPAVVTSTAVVAVPLLMAGAALLGAANPPLDAARLDIIHPALWGRAEAVRTVLRSLAEAVAPVAFGVTSVWLARRGADSLELTMLLFLVPLPLAGLLALTALRTYPRDVAAVAAAAHHSRTRG